MTAMTGSNPAGPRPSERVLAAFGRAEKPVRLAGGRGLAWRVGDLVLKPADLGPELEWQAEFLPTVRADGFRLAVPQRATDGALVVDDWSAWSYVAGEHRPGQWAEVIAVGERFHRALAGLPRPAFITARTDPWAIGDRVAWGEASIDPYRHIEQASRLVDTLEPVADPSQLVHGDLTGNVLIDDALPPAVIDVSLYWRPPAFASAIVVADALVWEGADETLFAAVAHVDRFGQFLARALLYRIVAAVEGRFEATARDLEDRYRPATDLAVLLAKRHRTDITEG
jgi:uncharacterized protein (TIGR02569 family)